MMSKLAAITVAVALLAFSAGANAGQIWTDGNGDGFPDGATIPATPSTNLTFGVWIDAQSFAWTNYLAYVEWQAGCMSYVNASYVITGGSNFPIDNFNHPSGVGFGGQGFSEGGVDQIGNVTLHVDGVACCVFPIIDINNPYYVFSQLGAGSSYMLFSTNPGSCLFGEGPCGDPCGACCFLDGSCQEVSAAECQAAGGIYQGDNVTCAQANCPPGDVEACCFPDGSCVDAFPGSCPAGSVPQGAGTYCAAVVCDGPLSEACCFCDGSCQDLTPAECVAQEGILQGPGTSCATTICYGAPLGACCFPDGSCAEGPACACEASGGVFQGVGTSCGAVSCVNAVESRSWGGIKGLYR